eukprot:TRINITY_DN1595_c0_g1_i3.p2 TRINITY_DN1595_c0_g1~~TRINITY_DN1595_c0_g1_i3.p2  ORF type:complete len:193 (+),score=4.93 TRINITY_DN1595_c0_g1_i3:246-824(+)
MDSPTISFYSYISKRKKCLSTKIPYTIFQVYLKNRKESGCTQGYTDIINPVWHLFSQQLKKRSGNTQLSGLFSSGYLTRQLKYLLLQSPSHLETYKLQHSFNEISTTGGSVSEVKEMRRGPTIHASQTSSQASSAAMWDACSPASVQLSARQGGQRGGQCANTPQITHNNKTLNNILQLMTKTSFYFSKKRI